MAAYRASSWVPCSNTVLTCLRARAGPASIHACGEEKEDCCMCLYPVYTRVYTDDKEDSCIDLYHIHIVCVYMLMYIFVYICQIIIYTYFMCRLGKFMGV